MTIWSQKTCETIKNKKDTFTCPNRIVCSWDDLQFIWHDLGVLDLWRICQPSSSPATIFLRADPTATPLYYAGSFVKSWSISGEQLKTTHLRMQRNTWQEAPSRSSSKFRFLKSSSCVAHPCMSISTWRTHCLARAFAKSLVVSVLPVPAWCVQLKLLWVSWSDMLNAIVDSIDHPNQIRKQFVHACKLSTCWPWFHCFHQSGCLWRSIAAHCCSILSLLVFVVIDKFYWFDLIWFDLLDSICLKYSEILQIRRTQRQHPCARLWQLWVMTECPPAGPAGAPPRFKLCAPIKVM